MLYVTNKKKSLCFSFFHLSFAIERAFFLSNRKIRNENQVDPYLAKTNNSFPEFVMSCIHGRLDPEGVIGIDISRKYNQAF